MNSVISQAVTLFKTGELVAFPTETVYGLGADASNPKAVKKIFEAKGRPADHPVIIHIYDFEQLKDWVENIPESAKVLSTYFWPGPMTLIFQAKPTVSSIITGNQSTVGIRMPSHPIARELLKSFGGAIAAPSANRFGHISPTCAQHVKEDLGDKVKLILEGGDCSLGLESTIIDVTQQPPRLLRPGPLTINQIKTITGISIVENTKPAPRVSGSLNSHYAPITPLYLMSHQDILESAKNEDNIVIILLSEIPENFMNNKTIIWKSMSNDPQIYAHNLYAILRKADKLNKKKILLELPPDSFEWQAIHDRLKRAASGKVAG